MRIFARVPWTVGVKRQWGNRKRIFKAFGRYVFGTLRNEANVYILCYLVPCRLSTDPKIRDLKRLEWLEWPLYVQLSILTITNRIAAIRLHI